MHVVAFRMPITFIAVIVTTDFRIVILTRPWFTMCNPNTRSNISAYWTMNSSMLSLHTRAKLRSVWSILKSQPVLKLTRPLSSHSSASRTPEMALGQSCLTRTRAPTTCRFFMYWLMQCTFWVSNYMCHAILLFFYYYYYYLHFRQRRCKFMITTQVTLYASKLLFRWFHWKSSRFGCFADFAVSLNQI